MFSQKFLLLYKEYKHTTVVEGSAVKFFICFWLTKLFSFLQHLHPKVDSLIHRLVHILPKPQFVIKNERGIFAVQAFDDSTTICSNYFEEELRTWLDRTSTKDIFIDIGANRGIYTVMALTKNGFATAHAFEPNQEVFAILEKNISLNQIGSNTRVHKAAAGSKAGILTLAVDPMHKGGGHITNEQAKHDISMEIDVVTLDSVLTATDMNKVGFVKIDTEGYEMEVLAGMKETLSSMPKESCIMIETTELKNIEELLNPYGFVVVEKLNADYLFLKSAV